MKVIYTKNTLRKYMLMITILLLFFAGGYRAFTLYKTYHSYQSEIESIQKNNDTRIHDVLRIVIEEAHDVIEYKTKMDSITLHRSLIESMSMDEIYNNIVIMNLNDEFIKILNNVFDLSEAEHKTMITIGTKDHVFYCKSNVDSDKYDHIDSDKEYLIWDDYYQFLDNPCVTKMAYEDLVLQRVEYVILHVDGYYPEGRYYNIDDVIADYHANGLKNMDKYYVLTVGVITDTGDIFGESDDIYLKHNSNVNKIYIFKAVSLGDYIKEYKPVLDSFDDSMSSKIIQVRNNTEFSNSLINIFLITVSIITIMIVIKSLDNENSDIKDRLDDSD